MTDSTSELLRANCDEFIYYDSLAAAARSSAHGTNVDPADMLRQTLTALQREGTEWPLASVVKDSMRRKNPAFDQSDIGYSTFSKFLEGQADLGTVRAGVGPAVRHVPRRAVEFRTSASPAAPAAAARRVGLRGRPNPSATPAPSR